MKGVIYLGGAIMTEIICSKWLKSEFLRLTLEIEIDNIPSN